MVITQRGKFVMDFTSGESLKLKVEGFAAALEDETKDLGDIEPGLLKEATQLAILAYLGGILDDYVHHMVGVKTDTIESAEEVSSNLTIQGGSQDGLTL